MVTLSSDYEIDRENLRKLLVKTRALQHSPEKKFLLVSGEKSEFYFDLKLLNGDPEGINAVAKVFYHHIRQMPQVTAVGGLESGSISIATAISQLSYFEHQRDKSNPLITSFYVRKERKEHGTGKLIEGNIKSPVVIIDDVITSGMSAIKAIIAVRERHDCQFLMSIIFRGSEQHRENIEKEIPFRYIFTKDELVAKFKEQYKELTA